MPRNRNRNAPINMLEMAQKQMVQYPDKDIAAERKITDTQIVTEVEVEELSKVEDLEPETKPIMEESEEHGDQEKSKEADKPTPAIPFRKGRSNRFRH